MKRKLLFLIGLVALTSCGNTQTFDKEGYRNTYIALANTTSLVSLDSLPFSVSGTISPVKDSAYFSAILTIDKATQNLTNIKALILEESMTGYDENGNENIENTPALGFLSDQVGISLDMIKDENNSKSYSGINFPMPSKKKELSIKMVFIADEIHYSFSFLDFVYKELTNEK